MTRFEQILIEIKEAFDNRDFVLMNKLIDEAEEIDKQEKLAQ